MLTRFPLALVCVVALSLGTLASGVKPSRAVAAAQVQVADILYNAADYRSALRLYLSATECDDRGVRDLARAKAVRTALRMAEFGVAATQFASLPAEGSRDPAMVALAGDTLWASGRFDEAEHAYRDAVAIDPGNARARHGLAKAYASRYQHERALDEALAALRLAPDDPDLLHTLGSIYERMHRYADAAAAYTTYLGHLRTRDEVEKARWAHAHVDFLRSFAGTVPYATTWRGNVRRHVMDFRLVDGKVMIKAKVNGKAFDFALDTGAEHILLTEATARRLHLVPFSETTTAGVGMHGLRGLQVAKLESVQVGPLTVRNVPCLIKSPVMRGLPTDQLEGLSPLDLGLSMSVDYRNHRLTLGELPPEDRAGGRELPLRVDRLATVTGDVDGTPVSFIVDTGGEGISLNTSMARTLFTPMDRYRVRLRVYGASGLDPEAYLLPGVNLSFGSLTLPNEPVVVLDLRAPSILLGYEVGGIVGYRFLSHYRVDFDLPHGVLRLRDL